VRLAETATPVEDLRRALSGRPQLLALDAIDSVTDPAERRRLRSELADALALARSEERPLALIVSCVDPRGLDDVLPGSVEPQAIALDDAPEPAGVHLAGERPTASHAPALPAPRSHPATSERATVR
jgi:RND superfamily putative drug exporter